ncbi:MAG: branched-chain amino acid transport system ATP-binding protein livF [Actinomycetota bacterium]|nr:branched-chain amino acid transport system ATP-binding protein livF [Actinomycetota bacterium]
MSESYFAVEHIGMSFGGLRVLEDVSFEVQPGEIVGLIGPNGAGKTTLFDVISGFRQPDRGKVMFKDVDLVDERPFRRAWLGLGRTFQTARLFQNETVLDTVKTACHQRMVDGSVRTLLSGVFATRRSVAREREAHERATQIIDRLNLGDYAPKLCAELSYGTLRLTELGTILAMEPELVLLDEPSSGIAQRETEALGPLLLELREELGATFLLIEHDMPLIMSISDRIVALAAGQVLAQGTPVEIQSNEAVVEAYLGTRLDLEEVVH